jgi:hypothetical protein
LINEKSIFNAAEPVATDDLYLGDQDLLHYRVKIWIFVPARLDI